MQLRKHKDDKRKWKVDYLDRLAWGAAICKGTKQFERFRQHNLDDKRLTRKTRVPNLSTAVPYQLCAWHTLRFHLRISTPNQQIPAIVAATSKGFCRVTVASEDEQHLQMIQNVRLHNYLPFIMRNEHNYLIYDDIHYLEQN